MCCVSLLQRSRADMSLHKNAKKRLTFQRVGQSTLHCCVPLCTFSARYNRLISFHSFPKLGNPLREQWVANIRRDFTPTAGTRVCSRHFLPGDLVQKSPESLRRLKPGAVPKLFHWNNYSLHTAASDHEMYRNISSDHEYCVTHGTAETREAQPREGGEQVLQSQADWGLMGSWVGLERYACSDDHVHHYTRFNSYRHFQHFWRLIEPAVKTHMTSADACAAAGSVSSLHTTKLPLIDELLLFLMHLSVGFPPEDLAVRFGLDAPAVSGIISAWGHFLSQLLGGTCLWLPGELVKALLPPEFETFSDTQVVLDCAEICCQRPSAALGHTEQCSTYKALVGMAPHGAVTFVSPLFAGTLSDCEVFKQSGITSVLQPHMAVMVVRGLLIEDVSPCRVHRPAYLPEHTQNQSQSRQSVAQTQTMVRLGVHVERCLRRVTDYKLFDRTAPAPVCGNIQELFHVACYLLNYQSTPLVHP